MWYAVICGVIWCGHVPHISHQSTTTSHITPHMIWWRGVVRDMWYVVWRECDTCDMWWPREICWYAICVWILWCEVCGVILVWYLIRGDDRVIHRGVVWCDMLCGTIVVTLLCLCGVRDTWDMCDRYVICVCVVIRGLTRYVAWYVVIWDVMWICGGYVMWCACMHVWSVVICVLRYADIGVHAWHSVGDMCVVWCDVMCMIDVVCGDIVCGVVVWCREWCVVWVWCGDCDICRDTCDA